MHETLARVVERLTRLEHESGDDAPAMAREPAQRDRHLWRGAAGPRAEPAPSPLPPGARRRSCPRTIVRSSPAPASPILRRSASWRAPRATASATGRPTARPISSPPPVAPRRRRPPKRPRDDVAEEPTEEGKPGTFARIGQAIRNRKRPLLLAAAALVLAISALQLFGEHGINERRPVALDRGRRAERRRYSGAAARRRGRRCRAPPTPTVPKVSEPAMVAPPPNGRSRDRLCRARWRRQPLRRRPDVAAGDRLQPPAPAPPRPPPTCRCLPPAPPWPRSTPDAPVAATSVSADAPIGPPKLREAAAAGDPAAAFEIAARYAEGNGGQPDLAKAAEWYRRAAEAGIAVAQYRLGSLYERGQGVARRTAPKPSTWYQRAADQGNVGAMHNLAVHDERGRRRRRPTTARPSSGSSPPPTTASRTASTISASSTPAASARTQDLVESYKWFAVAAAAAATRTPRLRRDEVAKALSPRRSRQGARRRPGLARRRRSITEANTRQRRRRAAGTTPTAGVTEADQPALVKKIQTLLAEQGYDPGPADGYEGPKTREAVQAFQRTIGMTETGQISGDLVAALWPTRQT